MVAWESRSYFYNHGQSCNIGLDSERLFNREVITRALCIPSREIDSAEHLLEQGLKSLRTYRRSVPEPPEILEAIDEMIAYVEFAKNVDVSGPLQTRFDLLAPLRSMLFWLPCRFIHILHSGPNVMLLIAHLHAIALLVDPVQDGESAFLRRLNVAPVQAFHEEFAMRAAMEVGPGETEVQYRHALELMNFPLNAVALFERRLLRFGCSEKEHIRVTELRPGIGWVDYDGNLTTLKILENYPVGLWHNSVSSTGDTLKSAWRQ